MASSAEQIRAYRGPALFSYGFRPLFLGAAAWAVLAMLAWIWMLAGGAALPSAFSPLDWHVHELLYGFLPAAIAGFLLTAVPNWTGRLPVVGPRLAMLVLVWLAGRLAVAVSALVPAGLAAAVDGGFLLLLMLVVGREILAGNNRRNLKVLGLVGLLLAGNALFHLEAARTGYAAGGYGARLGIAATVFLISLIGGRIVPSFTRNWLARRDPGRLPTAMNRFDMAALAAAGVALVLWIAAPEASPTGLVALLAGLLHLVRLGRWAGWRTAPEPLVWVLHAGYAFVPAGFLLLGLSILEPAAVSRPAALHAWLAGAAGVMTLAVMTRASLGHSGRPVAATPGITAVYLLAILGALARLLAGLVPGAEWALHLGAAGWIGAFGGFVLIFVPILLRPRGA